MPVELYHTIVPSRDQRAAATDLADLLGLAAAVQRLLRRAGLYWDSRDGYNLEVLTRAE